MRLRRWRAIGIVRNRKQLRIKGYDYSSQGAYFVTICTQNRECIFGDVVDGKMVLNKYGHNVDQSWKWLAEQYVYVQLDIWIIMPNHLHGIIVIDADERRGRSRTAPTIKRKPLGRLIGAFKTVSTKSIHAMSDKWNNKIWQRNYYEHIVRDDADLNRIREYIKNNPIMWERDRNNPKNFNTKIIKHANPTQTNN